MKKRILIGEESFERIIEGDYYYVDKTLFIKELLEKRGTVTLITRPRRFGKTLTMSMLKHFFDMNTDGRHLFDGLEIMEHEDIVEKHMGKYPVVLLSMKDIEESTYEKSLRTLQNLVSNIYQENLYIYESDALNNMQKEVFYSFFMRKAPEEDLREALKFLTTCLRAYHKKRVVVLMDEYDVPINNAYRKGFYTDMIDFMRGFMGSVFKTNDHLEFGVATGVLRISQESLFSSFNNPKVCGVMDEEFSSSIGFTEEEVIAACREYGLEDRFCDVKKWYDGYRFGGRDMYNPWGITYYLSKSKIGKYWANTGSMAIFEEVFSKGDDRLREQMAGLLTGAPVTMRLDDGIVYPLEYKNSDEFWTLLLNSGYIKPCSGAEEVDGPKFQAELVNLEVSSIFADRAGKWLLNKQPGIAEAISRFVELLMEGDAEGVKAALNDEILNNPSSFDFTAENSYHMFIFGMLLALSDDYVVLSNPESGRGRSDCLIKPNDRSRSAVAIEFKHERKETSDLTESARKALKQIEEKAYVHNLKKEGYERILKYGIAFHKRNCEVIMESETES